MKTTTELVEWTLEDFDFMRARGWPFSLSAYTMDTTTLGQVWAEFEITGHWIPRKILCRIYWHMMPELRPQGHTLVELQHIGKHRGYRGGYTLLALSAA
jgi:hypothetical protein